MFQPILETHYNNAILKQYMWLPGTNAAAIAIYC